MALLLVAAASVAAPGEAFGVPVRRLARRGVVVVAPPGTQVVVPPTPGPAPVVVEPGSRPRRRMAVPPAAASAPTAARAPVRAPAPAVSPASPSPKAAPTPAVASAAKPGTMAPENIPAPLPAAGGQPTVAGNATSLEESAAFTPAWYEKHSEAWRPAQPPADWWRVADVATVTAWLGQPVSTASSAAAGAGTVTTAGADDVDSDGLRSVLVLPAGHANGAVAAGDDWLPLGVFAVVQQAGGQNSSQPHNYQQLAVDRKGVIKGNFYDSISDTLQPIAGAVDRDALTASWTVGTNGSRFTAPIRAFAAAPRTVSVSSGGTSRQLQMLPIPRP